MAGERLPKQRPHGDEHPEQNSEEHFGAQVPHQDEEAGSISNMKQVMTEECVKLRQKNYKT